MQEKKEKSQSLQEQCDMLCSAVQTMQSMCCAFTGNVLRKISEPYERKWTADSITTCYGVRFT